MLHWLVVRWMVPVLRVLQVMVLLVVKIQGVLQVM